MSTHFTTTNPASDNKNLTHLSRRKWPREYKPLRVVLCRIKEPRSHSSSPLPWLKCHKAISRHWRNWKMYTSFVKIIRFKFNGYIIDSHFLGVHPSHLPFYTAVVQCALRSCKNSMSNETCNFLGACGILWHKIWNTNRRTHTKKKKQPISCRKPKANFNGDHLILCDNS